MNTELIEYYTNLLIIQYRNKPNASGTITAIIKALMIYDLIRAVENGYNIDDAIGVQLDILAKYVGAKRIVTGVDFSRTFFGYVEYVASAPFGNVAGYINYDEEVLPDAQYLEYNSDQQSIYTLNNEELRTLIKLKIAQNNSNHSVGEIDDILSEFFPDQVIFTDNFNMTISYIFDNQSNKIVEIAISENALPKPAAVGLFVDFVPDINNIFSYLDYSSDTPVDFGQGYLDYSQDPLGSYLGY